jgi:two-component system cell cycle response regulator
MTARILVVDDIVANVRLLEARLAAEYFDVETAGSGEEALERLAGAPFDLVLLDAMMPGVDGFEVCRRMRADHRTAHIPVVMVTALDQAADRVRGLEAGADDFLTKPVSDLALITRVKSLVRLKMLTDELHVRSSAARFGVEDPVRLPDPELDRPGRVLLVDDRPSSSGRIVDLLSPGHRADVETVPQEALFRAADGDYDLVVVNLQLEGQDPLRLCSQLRSLERTRALPILLVAEPEDTSRLLRGLDLGVNDYIVRPIDRQELLARVRTQVRRKRGNDRLRDNVLMTMEMAVVDQLTGLNNRRYLESHLPPLVQQAIHRGRSLSVMLVDVDHFKSVNDTYGHHAGDDVLKELAQRLRRSTRGIDLACRYGGEEFVVVMPDTDGEDARDAADRIRRSVAADPFVLASGRALAVTISAGVATVDRTDDTPESVIDRADRALYRAKSEGRNRVVAHAA